MSETVTLSGEHYWKFKASVLRVAALRLEAEAALERAVKEVAEVTKECGLDASKAYDFVDDAKCCVSERV